MEIQSDIELSSYTWWKVGGVADYFCLPQSVEHIEEALMFAASKGCPTTILGGGSNVLISDDGVEGLVICLKNFTGASVEITPERVTVLAFAGTLKAEVLKTFLKAKLPPALFLCGLPGDMGGGVVMNAGVSEAMTPREFVEIVDWFEVIRLQGQKIEKQVYKKEDVDWNYRHSGGWQPGVITRVQVSWQNQSDDEIPKSVKQATRSRLMKQPLNFPSCGSVFKNPEGNSSGALIEKAGLKGYQVGGAQISEKHANFIVNLGGAKASDIQQIIQHIQKTVSEQHNVELKTEVKFLGRNMNI